MTEFFRGMTARFGGVAEARLETTSNPFNHLALSTASFSRSTSIFTLSLS
jgi:hypothetical protein